MVAEARASAWVVSLIPLGLAAFLSLSQPDYMRILVTDPLGRTILTVGVVAWISGGVWFQRLTRFEF